MTVRTNSDHSLIRVENAGKINLRFSVKYSFHCICCHETTAQRHYVEIRYKQYIGQTHVCLTDVILMSYL